MAFDYTITKKSKTDEWYTPVAAVEVILPFLKSHSVIWCPFDKDESNYVQVLRRTGHKVVATHIDNGGDFFKIDPQTTYGRVDAVISNPLFSLRTEIFSRLYELNIPFAMFQNSTGLFDNNTRYNLFRDNGCEILVPRGRTRFLHSMNDTHPAAPFFQSVYVCHGILPHEIVFAD